MIVSKRFNVNESKNIFEKPYRVVDHFTGQKNTKLTKIRFSSNFFVNFFGISAV
jgi:hypothetical protein